MYKKLTKIKTSTRIVLKRVHFTGSTKQRTSVNYTPVSSNIADNNKTAGGSE